MAIFDVTYFSQCLSSQTKFKVILPNERMSLPDSGERDLSKPFRTLYLLHGFAGNYESWIHETEIAAFSLKYNLAVIMPDAGNSFYIDDEILDNYYEKMVAEELVEYTRRTFPLSRKKEDTIIGGLSMGGYGAMRLGLRHADVFGSIIALSSAFITDYIAGLNDSDEPAILKPISYYEHVFGDFNAIIGSDKDPKHLAKAAKDKNCLPRMFVACGQEDYLIENNRDFHKYLVQEQIEHTYVEGHGEHNWAYWNDKIKEALIWFAGDM